MGKFINGEWYEDIPNNNDIQQIDDKIQDVENRTNQRITTLEDSTLTKFDDIDRRVKGIENKPGGVNSV